MRSSCKRILVSIGLFAVVAPAAADTFLHEKFDGPTFPPSGWTVVDNAGSGVVWSDVAGSLEDFNYTSGGNDAASVSSERFPSPADFDTDLRTPPLAVTATPEGVHYGVHFLLNYQNGGTDQVDFSVSFDDGATWQEPALLTFAEDAGASRDTPGVCLQLDLELTSVSPGSADMLIRFRYHSPAGAPEGYAQIDHFVFDDTPEISACPVFNDDFELWGTSTWGPVLASAPSAAPSFGAATRLDRRRPGPRRLHVTAVLPGSAPSSVEEPRPRRRWWSALRPSRSRD